MTPARKWFHVLFPDASDEDELVPLYSLCTLLGRWEIHTPVKTFRLRYRRTKCDFYLFWDKETKSNRLFHSVFDAIQAGLVDSAS